MEFWNDVLDLLPAGLANKVRVIAVATDFSIHDILVAKVSLEKLEKIFLHVLDSPRLSTTSCQEIVSRFSLGSALVEKASRRWDEITLRELATVKDWVHAKTIFFDARPQGEAAEQVLKTWNELAIRLIQSHQEEWENELDMEVRVQLATSKLCCVPPGSEAEANLHAMCDHYTSEWVQKAESEEDLGKLLRVGSEFSAVGKLAKVRAFERLVGLFNDPRQVAILWRAEKAKDGADPRKIKIAEDRLRELMAPIINAQNRHDAIMEAADRAAGEDVGRLVKDIVITRLFETIMKSRKI